jgi:hypothetical protein
LPIISPTTIAKGLETPGRLASAQPPIMAAGVSVTSIW